MPLSFPALQGERLSGPVNDNAAPLSAIREKGKLQYATMKKNCQGEDTPPVRARPGGATPERAAGQTTLTQFPPSDTALSRACCERRRMWSTSVLWLTVQPAMLTEIE